MGFITIRDHERMEDDSKNKENPSHDERKSNRSDHHSVHSLDGRPLLLLGSFLLFALRQFSVHQVLSASSRIC